MRDRILAFLKAENKTSAQLAVEIGVQPSGVSHILSGRNNPSLDFVLKMLGRYKYLSSDWLLFGKGAMLNEKAMPTLFDNIEFDKKEEEVAVDESVNGTKYEQTQESGASLPIYNKENVDNQELSLAEKKVNKIVWFYNDNSFKEFSPENS